MRERKRWLAVMDWHVDVRSKVAFDERLTNHKKVVVESVLNAVPPFALSGCEIAVYIGCTGY